MNEINLVVKIERADIYRAIWEFQTFLNSLHSLNIQFTFNVFEENLKQGENCHESKRD